MNKYLIIGNIVIICIALVLLIITILKERKKKKQYDNIAKEYEKIKQVRQKEEESLQKLRQKIVLKQQEISNVQKEVYKVKSDLVISNKDLENIKALEKTYQETINKELDKINDLKQQVNVYYNQQKRIVEEQLNDFKTTSSNAATLYFENLEKEYNNAEARYKDRIASLEAEQSKAAADLNKLKETRAAAYEALLKQQEVKQNKDNYRLLPTASELSDIVKLQRVKLELSKPRILSMLIWQTFFQPIAKEKFPIILQSKTKTGIYKITNIKTNECYIGQSLDVYKRWSEHCKAGLGIDTPVGNKLYKAIQNYGLENFTFELLCECPKEQLNEKEKYFIELYQSDTYGYNGNIGINK